MKVPQFLPWLDKTEYEALLPCFEQNWITEGPQSKIFVEKILNLTQSPYGVLAPNGTLAIYLALRALDIGPGDEVLVPNFTFLGSASAVEMTGAIPIFVDVNPYNFQVDVQTLSKALTPKTAAVMPVHIYGTTVDMDPILEFAKQNNLKVIEDAAQAVGLSYKGRHAGTIGDIGTFSFFADKTITTGEGGFILTKNKRFYERLCYLRNQGRLNRGSFIHPEIGYNFRMTDLQCAVGNVQIEKLETIKNIKIETWQTYQRKLKSCSELRFFIPEKEANFIPFRVPVLTKKAHALMDALSQKGIESRTFFYPLHRQPCFKNMVLKQFATMEEADFNFKESIRAYEEGVCLPCFPTITEEQIDYVCKSILDFFKGSVSVERKKESLSSLSS